MTFVLTGLDIEAKAELAERTLWSLVPGGRESFDAVDVRLRRTDRDDPATNDDALAELRITVMDRDEEKVGPGLLEQGHRDGAGQLPRACSPRRPPTRRARASASTGRRSSPPTCLDHAVVVGGERIAVPAPPTSPPPLAATPTDAARAERRRPRRA